MHKRLWTKTILTTVLAMMFIAASNISYADETWTTVNKIARIHVTKIGHVKIGNGTSEFIIAADNPHKKELYSLALSAWAMSKPIAIMHGEAVDVGTYFVTDLYVDVNL